MPNIKRLNQINLKPPVLFGGELHHYRVEFSVPGQEGQVTLRTQYDAIEKLAQALVLEKASGIALMGVGFDIVLRVEIFDEDSGLRIAGLITDNEKPEGYSFFYRNI